MVLGLPRFQDGRGLGGPSVRSLLSRLAKPAASQWRGPDLAQQREEQTVQAWPAAHSPWDWKHTWGGQGESWQQRTRCLWVPGLAQQRPSPAGPLTTAQQSVPASTIPAGPKGWFQSGRPCQRPHCHAWHLHGNARCLDATAAGRQRSVPQTAAAPRGGGTEKPSTALHGAGEDCAPGAGGDSRA